MLLSKFKFSAALIIVYSATGLAAPQGMCSQLFPAQVRANVPIQIRDVKGAGNVEILKKASDDLLSLVSGHMPLPEAVLMVNSEYSPQYNEGMIKIRFPFFVFGENQVMLKKSPQESLAIHLHELSHQVFETAINTWYSKSPEILWAFFSRADGIYGMDSLSFIQSTKGLTKYQNQSADFIQEKFLNYVDLATRYNELFADTLAVLTLKDPDAIYNNLYFKEQAQSKNPFTRHASEANELRRFNKDHSLQMVEESMAESPHGALAPTRTFIWRNIYIDYHKVRHSEVPLGEVAARIAKTLVLSMAEVTHNFEIPPEQLSARVLNENLIKNLSLEFQ